MIIHLVLVQRLVVVADNFVTGFVHVIMLVVVVGSIDCFAVLFNCTGGTVTIES